MSRARAIKTIAVKPAVVAEKVKASDLAPEHLVLMHEVRDQDHLGDSQKVLSALLSAAGIGAVTYSAPKYTDSHYPMPPQFSRDLCFVMPQKGIALTQPKHFKRSLAAIQPQLDRLGLQCIEPQDRSVYFEGGNLLYLPKHDLLLHGANPGGHYRESKTRAHKGSIVATHAFMQQVADKEGFDFMPVTVNATKLNFHLDMCMHPLPDGRLVLFYQEALHADSFNALKQRLGDDLVVLNLKCLEDVNWVTCQTKSRPVLIMDRMPRDLRFMSDRFGDQALPHVYAKVKQWQKDYAADMVKLKSLGYRIITPAVLDAKDPSFDADLAAAATPHLKVMKLDLPKASQTQLTSYSGGPHCKTHELWLGKNHISIAELKAVLKGYHPRRTRSMGLFTKDAAPSAEITAIKALIAAAKHDGSDSVSVLELADAVASGGRFGFPYGLPNLTLVSKNADQTLPVLQQLRDRMRQIPCYERAADLRPTTAVGASAST